MRVSIADFLKYLGGSPQKIQYELPAYAYFNILIEILLFLGLAHLLHRKS